MEIYYSENIDNSIASSLLGKEYNETSKYYMVNDYIDCVVLEVTEEGKEIEHTLNIDEVNYIPEDEVITREETKKEIDKWKVFKQFSFSALVIFLTALIFLIIKIFGNL